MARTLEVHLTDEVASRLEQAAAERGVTLEQLVQMSVEEKIESDARFDAAASKVLEKNAEQYRRLA